MVLTLVAPISVDKIPDTLIGMGKLQVWTGSMFFFPLWPLGRLPGDWLLKKYKSTS